MKNLFEHIEHVKGKPHHIRKQVALSAAALGTAFVTVMWLATSYVTGAFAIHGSSFALATQQAGIVATTSASDNTSGLAGAAAAFDNSSAPAHIEIVDTTPAPEAQKKQSDQTIIPF